MIRLERKLYNEFRDEQLMDELTGDIKPVYTRVVSQRIWGHFSNKGATIMACLLRGQHWSFSAERDTKKGPWRICIRAQLGYRIEGLRGLNEDTNDCGAH